MADGQGRGILINDDQSRPRISIGDVVRVERGPRRHHLQLPANLRAPEGASWTTVPAAVTHADDYVSASGGVSF